MSNYSDYVAADLQKTVDELRRDIHDCEKKIEELKKYREQLREQVKYWESTYWDLSRLYDEALKQIMAWRTVAKMMIAQIDPESPAWAEYWKVQRGEQ